MTKNMQAIRVESVIALKCPTCGAPVSDKVVGQYKCEYCGTILLIERTREEVTGGYLDWIRTTSVGSSSLIGCYTMSPYIEGRI